MNVLKATLDTRHQNSVIGNVTQFDNATLELQVVTDGVIDEAWKFPEFELIAMKRDMNPVREVDQDRFTILSKEDHKVQIELKEQFLTCRGTVKMQLIVKDGSRESTTLFYLMVGQSLDRAIIESHMDVKVLDDLEAYIQTGREVIYDAQEIVTGLKVEMSEFNTVSLEKETERQASELNRASKELIRVDNEEERVANEQVRVDNEEIRVNNEEERVQNEQDRVTNETTRRLAETTRIAQERARQDAELQRNSIFEENENLRKEGEKTRIANENERKKKFENWEGRETTRLKSEENRIIQEKERVINEEERQRQEQTRQNQEDYRQRTYTQFNEAEASRVNKELQRQSAEEKRVAAEANRQSNYVESENERDRQYAEAEEVRNNAFEQNEANRQSEYTEAERERVESEELRKSRERERETAETNRVNAETERVNAEQGRVNRFNSEIEKAKNTMNEAVADVNTAIATADSTMQGIEGRAEACLPIIEDSATAKVDYMGNEHKSIKAARDADVDWILGEVNTAHYEGQHITALDTLEGRAKSAILKGQTLVNLVPSNYSIDIQGITTAWQHSIFLYLPNKGSGYNIESLQSVKSNAKYLLRFYVERNTVNNKFALNNPSDNSVFSTYVGVNAGETGWFNFILTSKEIVNENIVIRFQNATAINGDIKVDKIMLMEYVEGMENWDIPYFEGMQSVKMPVLKTTGKNLVNSKMEMGNIRSTDGSLYDSNTHIRTKDYIPINPSTNNKVTLSNNKGYIGVIFEYNENHEFIKYTTGKNDVTVATLNGDCRFIKFRTTDSSNATDLSALFQLEYGSINSSYEPYKSNILTTAGKNLFNMNRPYDVITDSQATVVQDTNQITVSSAESGIYVNANFILDKDFFAGKTVTGSCLYESDENDIGTVQIAYQDGNGEHHYQWIKTPKTFTFPNSFIGDVMLSISENNTGTPQSNTVTVKNIQLELGSTATPYEPYSEVTLRGIGDVKDELNCLTGELTQRIKEVVFDGSEDWIRSADFSNLTNTVHFQIQSDTVGIEWASPLISDKFINQRVWAIDLEGVSCATNGNLAISINRDRLSGLEVADFKKWLSQNNVTVVGKSEESIKTVDLSGQKVYSYDGTTHYSCSAAEGSLIPTLAIDVPTNLPALVSRQRATIESQKDQIITLEQENEQLIAQNEMQDIDISLNQDAINFMLFAPATISVNDESRNNEGVNTMAAYLANQILKGKLDYTLVVSRYGSYKEDIDTILIAEGKQDLIK